MANNATLAALYEDDQDLIGAVVEGVVEAGLRTNPDAELRLHVTLVQSSTTDLFSMTFSLSATGANGQADIEWDVGVPAGGIGPLALSLQNPSGAGIDFAIAAVGPGLPALLPLGAALLASLYWLLGGVSGGLRGYRSRASGDPPG